MTTSSAPMTLDVSQTPRVPFSRLVTVELRKMVDTRAGRWLLDLDRRAHRAGAGHPALGGARPGPRRSPSTTSPAWPTSRWASCCRCSASCSVTSEWSQRTAMVTFTLEPHRAPLPRGEVVGTLHPRAVVADRHGWSCHRCQRPLRRRSRRRGRLGARRRSRSSATSCSTLIAMSTGFAFGDAVPQHGRPRSSSTSSTVHPARHLRAGHRCWTGSRTSSRGSTSATRRQPLIDGRHDRQGVGPAAGRPASSGWCCRSPSASGGSCAPR